jgi:hypothetical protein
MAKNLRSVILACMKTTSNGNGGDNVVRRLVPESANENERGVTVLRERCRDRMRQATTAGVRHDESKAPSFMRQEAGTDRFRCPRHPSQLGLFAMDAQKPGSPVLQSKERLFS